MGTNYSRNWLVCPQNGTAVQKELRAKKMYNRAIVPLPQTTTSQYHMYTQSGCGILWHYWSRRHLCLAELVETHGSIQEFSVSVQNASGRRAVAHLQRPIRHVLHRRGGLR